MPAKMTNTGFMPKTGRNFAHAKILKFNLK